MIGLTRFKTLLCTVAPLLLAPSSAPAATASPRQSPDTTIHADTWPVARSPLKADAALEARIDALIAQMSIEDKVGQIIQVDTASIMPSDVVRYKIGSILSGGNSSPGNDERAPLGAWVALADQFYDASMTRDDDRPRIPLLWGVDAVHGHNNLVGATLYPQNIGLGAARDPALVRKIGAATALEMKATGFDWDFAPSLGVVRDDRWGRTYESYGEDPHLVASYAGEMVQGLQGVPGTTGFMGPGRVVATAKHFLGDGGTGGRDQGDTKLDEAVLRDIHGAAYPVAINAGVLTVMASFSSWNGVKMHGNAALLMGVLKGRMGFDGVVVGDWNGHAQVPGCTAESCAAAINAGLDMFMSSGNWKALYANTLAQARSGKIPAARLDDAVRRILRLKFRIGLFAVGRPSARRFVGNAALLGSAEHRALARRAVRESLVLLKNNHGLLPLRPNADIMVAGSGADDIAQQSGGWTITWQGIGLTNADFPHGQSIYAGIKEAVAKAGGNATWSADGNFTKKPEVAVVVFGEKPYAEFMGDRPNLEYSQDDKTDLVLLRKLKAAGVPVVAVFLSGRPLWVNAEINASDAFVAAFLPGTEGGGVADVLLRKPNGAVDYDFHGTLPFSWPKSPDQTALNIGDASYDPLFRFGYGLKYADRRIVPTLSEKRPLGLDIGNTGPLFGRGAVSDRAFITLVEDGQSKALLIGNGGRTGQGVLSVIAVDRTKQEDSRRLIWNGQAPADFRIESTVAADLTREVNGELSLVIAARVDQAPTGTVAIGMISGLGKRVTIPVTAMLLGARVGQWQDIAIPLKCFVAAGLDPANVTVPFIIGTAGAATISVFDVRIASANVPMNRCGQ